MLANGHKVRGDGALRAINIRSTPSFGEEVRRCRTILRHVKKPYEATLNFLRQFIPICYYMTLLAGLSEGYGRRIRNFSLSIAYHSAVVLYAPTSSGASTICPLVAAVQRRSLTPWHDHHHLQVTYALIFSLPQQFNGVLIAKKTDQRPIVDAVAPPLPSDVNPNNRSNN
jgi:hypothetical protein